MMKTFFAQTKGFSVVFHVVLQLFLLRNRIVGLWGKSFMRRGRNFAVITSPRKAWSLVCDVEPSNVWLAWNCSTRNAADAVDLYKNITSKVVVEKMCREKILMKTYTIKSELGRKNKGAWPIRTWQRSHCQCHFTIQRKASRYLDDSNVLVCTT